MRGEIRGRGETRKGKVEEVGAGARAGACVSECKYDISFIR